MIQESEQPIDAQAEQATGEPQAQGEKFIPASQVERIVRDRLERDRKARSQQQPQQQAKATDPGQPQAQEGAYRSDPAIAELAAKVTFRDTLDEVLGDTPIKAEVRKTLLEAFMGVKPADPAEWLRTKVAAFGLTGHASEPQVTNQQTPNQPTLQQAKSPALSNAAPPSPSQVPDVSDDKLTWQLTAEEIARMSDKFGSRQAAVKIRERFREQLKRAHVVPSLRK